MVVVNYTTTNPHTTLQSYSSWLHL